MNKKTILLVAAAVLVLGGAGAGVYFFIPEVLPAIIRPVDGSRKQLAKKGDEERKHDPEIGVDLDVFVVNLAGQTPARYLRTTLSVGVKSEKEREELKELSGPIRNAVIMYLTERKVEELLEPEGKRKLRGDLVKQINAAVGKKIVSNVYFKEFLIQ